jgi:sulfatase maturation enzyme AslB (radical SAM superfamily)
MTSVRYMSKLSLYPPFPEPLRVEIEPTNICNACCEFCPRSNMKRKTGYMNIKKYSSFLKRLEKYRDGMWLNKHGGQPYRFPRLVFCGLGEPTLHPRIIDIIRKGGSLRFETELVTNGSTLTKKMAKSFIDSGLNTLAISLHSLDYDKYFRLTGLRLEEVLPRIKDALSVLDGTRVKVEIWRVSRLDGSLLKSDKEEAQNYRKLLSAYKNNIKVLGPTVAWNRGGQYPQKFWGKAKDTEKIWCEKLYFTLNIEWDGNVIMCCCDYAPTSVVLGNAWKDSIKSLQLRRKEKFESSKKERICLLCRRPKDTFYRDYVIPTLVR